MYNLDDIKKMDNTALEGVAKEIREELIRITDANGGHLASNLGTVELTLALHSVFDSPNDKILFDVGHQAYTHKLLTGRNLGNMRHVDGVSGFPDPAESEHDHFIVGHSATAVSTALGLARARDINKQSFHIIAVVGDGAFGGGMNFEAINDLGYNKTPVIIVLNDNGMSISRNVGAISKHLVKLRTAKGYIGLKKGLEKFLKGIPLIGVAVFNAALKIKNLFRRTLIGNTVFDNMGIKYIGSVDGHNIAQIKNILSRAKDETVPVLIQLRTQKGKGKEAAELDPAAYHGVAPAKIMASNGGFTESFGNAVCELALNDDRICAITAGMTDSTGLKAFAEAYKQRFFDVGIAEQHALGLAAGLAKGGMKPIVALYSTFLQRGADQIFHDIALQKLPVIMAIDRAGFVGQDGQTHQGAYDLAILRANQIKIFAPASKEQLNKMLKYALMLECPCAIRYPKGCGIDINSELLKNGMPALQNDEMLSFDKWQNVINHPDSDAVIITFGALLGNAIKAAAELVSAGIKVSVVNACIVEADIDYISSICAPVVVVFEDNMRAGGLGEAIAQYISHNTFVKRFDVVSGEKGMAIHDGVGLQQKYAGLDATGMAEKIKELVNK